MNPFTVASNVLATAWRAPGARLRRRLVGATLAGLVLHAGAQPLPPPRTPASPWPAQQPMPPQTTLPPQSGTLPPMSGMDPSGMAPAMPMPMPMPSASGTSSRFLMPIVISALTPVLQAGFGCVFDRLFSFMGANPNPMCVQPNQTAVVRPPDGMVAPGMNVAYANPSPPGPVMDGAGAAPGGYPQALPPASGGQPQPLPQAVGAPMPAMTAPAAPANVQTLAATPVLSFIVNKLSDASPQATVTQTVQFANVQQGGNPLAFDIRTGEAFAILFATSVPGRVRLVNTDVNQQVAASDVYEALPAADNRMPRDWQGGIVMTGAKGTEYLDVNFTPCISPRYASDSRVAIFQGQLPPCTVDGDAALATPRQAGAKAMVFPTSPSPGQPIGLAPSNYARGEALTFRITVRHQ